MKRRTIEELKELTEHLITYSCTDCEVSTEAEEAIPDVITELEELRQWQADALEWLKLWRDHEDCDCPAEGHLCGFPELDQFINRVTEPRRDDGKD